jgi:hypothetical protein
MDQNLRGWILGRQITRRLREAQKELMRRPPLFRNIPENEDLPGAPARLST